LVVEDWKKLQALPARALDSFYDLVKPSLGPQAASRSDLESRAQAYCRLYGIEQDDLSAALRSCVFFLTRASQLAMPLEAFRQDLEAMSTDNPAVVDVIVSRYEEARTLIRQEMVQGSLFDHGKVLVGIDWRLDMIHASDRGAELGMPVALLTLRCLEGQGENSREERVTLYAIPEMIRQFRATLDRLDQQLAPPRGRHVTREELAASDSGSESES